jgi:allantoin racemase
MRIWYQSFTDPAKDTGYLRRLRDYLGGIADPGTEVDLDGLTPSASAFSRLNELRCGLHAINRAIEVEAEGYDAVVIGHFQEPGLYEARSSVDIPVVGLGEASMHYALHAGRRFGLVTIHPIFTPIHQEQADRYGVASRLVGVTAMDAPLSDIIGAFTDDDAAERTLAAFAAAAEPLVDAGADVLIPAGGLPGLLIAARRGYAVRSVPVLNPLAIALKRAEMEVKLHGLTGLLPSQTTTFAKAPANAIEYFRKATRTHDGG